MSEANKALVRRYYAEAMGDLSGIGQLVTTKFVDHHMPPGLPPGPEGVREFFKDIRIPHTGFLCRACSHDSHQ